MTRKPILFIVNVCAAMLLLAGCKVVQPDNVSKFGQGVLLANQQADAAFSDANTLAREESINYLIATTKPGITEADFTPALNADDIAKWDTSFSKIEAYVSLLEQLLSGDQATQFGTATVALGTQLKSGPINAQISPGVATGFTQLGEILISLKSEQDAQRAMLKADPAIKETLQQMAAALGDSNKTGIRGTVWSNWITKLTDGPGHDYSEAVRNNNNLPLKKAAAEAYAAMLAQRDSQLASLASLRQSLLVLADAHTAAANGSTASVTSLISTIDSQLSQTQTLLAGFKAVPPASASKTN